MKKWIITAALALTGTLILLWILGGRMAEYRAQAGIAATPAQIYPYLVEPDRLKQWLGGLVESTPLTEGGTRVGARSREIVEENGRRFELESLVLDVRTNELLVVEISGSMGLMRSEYRLTGEGARTRVHHIMNARYKGFIRLLAPFIKGMVQRKIEGDLERLRQAVEASAREPR
jgi:carbon monoxide dehydrogenase subunit G